MALSKKNPPKSAAPKAEVKIVPQSRGLLDALRKKMKSKKVKAGMAAMQAKYGKEKIFGTGNPMVRLEVWPSGFYEVDHEVIGRGGFPRGRCVEISGPEASGKTTFFLYALANFQRLGLVVGFVDAENAMDVEYAQACGVHTDLWFYGIPLSGEETVDMALNMLNGKFGTPCHVVVVDSTGAMKPKDHQKKSISDMAQGKGKVGARAALQDKLIMDSKPTLLKNQSLLALVSQIRMNVGAKQNQAKTKTTTAKALDHEFSFRLVVRGGEKLKNEAGEVIGRKMIFNTSKNKIGNPFQTREIEMMYGFGLSPECSILDAAIRNRLVTKNGSWHVYEQERLGNGRAKTKEFLKENPNVLAELEARLTVIRETGVRPEAEEPDDPFNIDDIEGEFGG